MTYQSVMGGGPEVIMGRCNPYGHESGGPRHLIGGVYGPEYEGPQKWICPNRAVVRVRGVCERGHPGEIQSWCRSHAIEIQRRQSGLCPRCAFPPEALMWNEAIEKWQNELAVLHQAGRFYTSEGERIRQHIEDAGHRMTELFRNGTIKQVPIRWHEIS